MNKLITTHTGGHPLTLDDLEFMDNAYRDVFNSIFRAFVNSTNSLIIQGCEVNGNNISAGYILLDGELLKVDAHTRTGDYYQKVVSYDPAIKVYKNGEQRQVYQKARAVCSSATSYGLAYNSRRLFGNTSGQITEGNDSRLSDSRKCNNTFDNAAVARQNLDVFSKGEVDTKFNNLVGGAPGILDTLGEIAAALGNNGNLAAALTNAIQNEVNARVAAIANEASVRNQVINSEAQSRINADNALLSRFGGLTIACIPIGAWNMLANGSKTIDISAYTTIANFRAILDVRILHDDGQMYIWPLTRSGEAHPSQYDNLLHLNRTENGSFHIAGYDSVELNRGFVTFAYVA